MINVINRKKIKKGVALFFSIILLLGVTSVSFASSAEAAAGTKYNHNHNGYTCYKMSYYVSPSKCKDLSKQTSKLNTVALIANFIGLSGLTAGIVSMVFGSAVSANAVFVKAASQGKGVQMNYIAHFSNSTTDIYNSNQNYVIK